MVVMVPQEATVDMEAITKADTEAVAKVDTVAMVPTAQAARTDPATTPPHPEPTAKPTAPTAAATEDLGQLVKLQILFCELKLTYLIIPFMKFQQHSLNYSNLSNKFHHFHHNTCQKWPDGVLGFWGDRKSVV